MLLVLERGDRGRQLARNFDIAEEDELPAGELGSIGKIQIFG